MKRRTAQGMRTVFLCLALLLGVITMSTHSQKPSAVPPFYADKQNLLNYIDDQGVIHPVQSLADWEKRRAHIMANMLLVMGEMPDESRRVPLDVEVLEEVQMPRFVRKKITFGVEKGDRLPAYLFIPNNLKSKVPAMLCMHPTSALGKAQVTSLGNNANRQYASELAGRGYVTLAPDYPGYGDYKIDVYKMGYVSATMKGIWNHKRSVDLLQSLPEVDAERIGVIGHSLGGHNSLFVAAFDERLKLAVTSCGFNAFAKYLGGNLAGWSHEGYMPRIAEVYDKDPAKMPFDFSEILAFIAPRTIFINAPLRDGNFEVSGVHDSINAARPVFQLLGAEDNLVAIHPDTGHDFPPDVREETYTFIDRTFGFVGKKQPVSGKHLELEPILDISLGTELSQLRGMSVRLGKGKSTALLVVYSSELSVDPWSEAFFFPKDTLKLALFNDEGERLWYRDLGPSVMPGSHFCPVSAFDLDGDGKDEIWFVNNIDLEHPLSLNGRRLERIDAATGETTGQWKWPSLAGDTQSLSSTHRNFIFGGYVKGEPVLVTAQGTYGPMFLQGWRPDMTQRWDLRIGVKDPGARGSHGYAIFDLNGDGIDEVMWGERCIELDKGTELFCADRDVYRGHSDVVKPFQDPETGQWYIYTCREGDPNASPRVVLFDHEGKRVWGHVDKGHIDMGWVANLGENGRPVAMAIRIGAKHFTSDGIVRDVPEQFTFDAITGEEYPLGFDAFGTIPANIDGDVYDELLRDNEILDHYGNVIGRIDGTVVGASQYLDNPKPQILSHKPDGTVQIWVVQ